MTEQLFSPVPLENNRLFKKNDPYCLNNEFPICRYVSHWSWYVDENKIKIDTSMTSKKYINRLENLLGTNKTSIHPSDISKVYNQFIETLDQNHLFNTIDFRLKDHQDNYQWIRAINAIINYDDHQTFTIKGIYKILENKAQQLKEKKIQKAKFQQLFHHFNAGVVLLNNSGMVVDVNKKFTELFGYTIDEAKGNNLDELITPNDYISEGRLFTKKIINGGSIEVETIRKDKNGVHKDIFMNAFPINLEDSQLGGYAIYYDITERKEIERNIKYLSFHDGLTGLYNRRYFENEIDRLDDSRNLPISIIMGDMDDFKRLNDTYGHHIGDKYLKVFSKLLINELRKEDISARIGGDEFAIILPGINETEAKQIIERILLKADSYAKEFNLPEKIKISLGYATKYSRQNQLKNIFNQADKKMYEKKNKTS